VRFLFCGDPHGEFGLVREYGRNADAVVLLGDQTPSRPLAEELGPVAERTWFVLGNHDTSLPGYFLAHRGEMWDRNLHARVVDFFGIRVAGLGGVFRGRVWHPREGGPLVRTRAEMAVRTPDRKRFLGGVPLEHWSSIFPEDFPALLDQTAKDAPVDVLVAHEAPECHRHGFEALSGLARALGVKVILHGHHHHDVYAASLSSGIKVFGLGLRGFNILDAQDIEAMPRPDGWKAFRRELAKKVAGWAQ
jgi:predicted phosphodiesterase